MTREQWLNDAVDFLRPVLFEVRETFLGEMRATEEHPHDLPPVRVSVGWPSRGGMGTRHKVIGQCWKTTVAADGIPQIFISPVLGGSPMADAILLGVLIHELIHAWDDCQAGHRGRFARTARAVGLEGKMTATVVGDDLLRRITAIQRELGPYPHSPLDPATEQRKPQTTRMLKLECPSDGYIVRTTAKWLDLMGIPSCPCGQQFEPAE